MFAIKLKIDIFLFFSNVLALIRKTTQSQCQAILPSLIYSQYYSGCNLNITKRQRISAADLPKFDMFLTVLFVF